MNDSLLAIPRVVVSALRGGAGKTILSIGLVAAWRRYGRRVAPFKKGPDYIDAGWLTLAAGRPCHNLDTFLVSPPAVRHHFTRHAAETDVALIEGNRGLFDGLDTRGATSTAELARLLEAPVLLAVDCTKATRTLAAQVLGCQHFDPDTRIAGVILNRVGGARHERIVRRNIEVHCGLPVVGAVPRLEGGRFPERHMGLVPTAEHGWAQQAVDAAADAVEAYLDLARIAALAAAAPALTAAPPPTAPPDRACANRGNRPLTGPVVPTVGVIRDAAFQFYYPENLAALAAAGARIREISPLDQDVLPDVDALYIGGGFPETHAAELSANKRFRTAVRQLADDGLPIYAECGGLMYLGRALAVGERTYPMAGVVPAVFGLFRRPQGHGYVEATVRSANPFYERHSRIRGHEFHYSRVLEWQGRSDDLVLRVDRGTGLLEGRDGYCRNNVLAAYTHIHALGNPAWAPAVVRAACRYRLRKTPASASGTLSDVRSHD